MSKLNMLLLLVVVGCAIGVITSQHLSRKRFSELETEQATSRKLAEEWTQLQLEQSTWATHKRVEAVAAKSLGMRLPDVSSTVVVAVERAR